MEMASYATFAEKTRGRLYPEREAPYRSCFQRDRDRIIHSEAFRRLESKTQVFVYHEGNSLRTRLTHSLEVSQITRSLCRMLGLNQDLGEALALAHDLGHIVIGVNKEWKQEVNIGKRNNQNFVMLPHGKFVEMIRYKAQDYGIHG